jgi:hypothetical protein
VIKVELLFSAVVFAVWVYTLAEVVMTPEGAVRNLPKVGWFVVVLLFPLLGSAAWFVLGRPEGARRLGAYERSAPAYPEYDRPGRAAAADPEKDAEFLAQVRARAEAQRQKHAEDRKRREAEGS